VAAVLVVPFGVIQAGVALLDPALILPGLAVALMSTALPYTLEMIVMGRMSVRVFGVLMSLEPAIGAASGWLFLHQRLSPPQMLAIVAVIAASAGVAVTAGRAAPDA
jgi:inner membrane transporter RhtA